MGILKRNKPSEKGEVVKIAPVENASIQLMQLPRINASYAEKINTGNYENVTLSFSLSDDLKPGVKTDDGLMELFKTVKATVERAKQEHRIHSIMDSGGDD